MNADSSSTPSFPTPGDLLPHRPPMLLLRAVLSHRSDQTRCEGWIACDFAGADDGQVAAAFGLELIAQTAAVHHALCELAHRGDHLRAEHGLLLGSRRLHLAARTLPCDARLEVAVTGVGGPPGPGGLIRFEGWVADTTGRVLVSGDATVLEVRPGQTDV